MESDTERVAFKLELCLARHADRLRLAKQARRCAAKSNDHARPGTPNVVQHCCAIAIDFLDRWPAITRFPVFGIGDWPERNDVCQTQLSGSIPASSSISRNALPAGPTKGLPCAASSTPGASPTTYSRGRRNRPSGATRRWSRCVLATRALAIGSGAKPDNADALDLSTAIAPLISKSADAGRRFTLEPRVADTSFRPHSGEAFAAPDTRSTSQGAVPRTDLPA